MEYQDLDVWKKARSLVKTIYVMTGKFPDAEKFGLTSQMRRSAVSIPSNIAEGCGRLNSKETIHFLHIARGSAFELETQVFLSLDLGYLSDSETNSVINEITECKKLLNGFINYYKKNIISNN